MHQLSTKIKYKCIIKYLRMFLFVLAAIAELASILLLVFMYLVIFGDREKDFRSVYYENNTSRISKNISVRKIFSDDNWYDLKYLKNSLYFKVEFRPIDNSEITLNSIKFELKDSGGNIISHKNVLFRSGEFYSNDIGTYYADLPEAVEISGKSSSVIIEKEFSEYFFIGYTYDISNANNTKLFLSYRIRYSIDNNDYCKKGIITYIKKKDEMVTPDMD